MRYGINCLGVHLRSVVRINNTAPNIVNKLNSNFCPAPWMSLFAHGDSTGICCVDTGKLKVSPLEFRSSQHLKEIKQQFLEGKQPSICSTCWRSESQGLQSIRQHYIKNNPEYTDSTKFSLDTELPVEHIELRSSNLCNFSCRMCNSQNSIEIKREIENKSHLSKWFYSGNFDSDMPEKNWKEVLEITKNLKKLFLTGGEPLLMKEYYDLLQHIIDTGRSKEISLIIYTNCSVYNPKFIDMLLQFKNVKLCLSVDAVGKVAEYQRHGTKWNVVYENVMKFCKLQFQIQIQSTISAYTLLDFSKLSSFYNEILKLKNDAVFNAHVVLNPRPLNYMNLFGDLRNKAIQEIEISLSELEDNCFYQVKNQLKNILTNLREGDTIDSTSFVNMTKDLDVSRNENFQEVFGYII